MAGPDHFRPDLPPASPTPQSTAEPGSIALREALCAIVGATHVLSGSPLPAFEVDWRKRYQGRALAVVQPADTAEVAAVVRCCAAYRVSLVPQGGNTGLVGGGVPDASGQQVLLSLKRLARVRGLDAANLTMTVEAGCVLQTVQDAADQAGLLFPLSLAAEGSCTIGGNLATNAGGTQVLRYGNARELCLGLEVVTPQGDVWDGLSGLRKDNTGYDLRDVLIGSEGTLGVITAATLKLFPRPGAVVTALATCRSLADCVALLGRARQRLDAGLTGFEVMNQVSLGLVARHCPDLLQPLPAAPWTVLMEAVGPDEATARDALENLLAAALQDGVAGDVVVASNLRQSRGLWQLREAIPLAQSQEGLNIKHDIALPVSAIPAFVGSTDTELWAVCPGIRSVNFGHLGDGNLHYNVQAPPGMAAADFLARFEPPMNAVVYEAVRAHGGSISAEHGIGQLKLDALEQHKSPVALGMMRAIKTALDPQGVMNPGRVVRGGHGRNAP